jgi:hypothetical protein
MGLGTFHLVASGLRRNVSMLANDAGRTLRAMIRVVLECPLRPLAGQSDYAPYHCRDCGDGYGPENRPKCLQKLRMA